MVTRTCQKSIQSMRCIMIGESWPYKIEIGLFCPATVSIDGKTFDGDTFGEFERTL